MSIQAIGWVLKCERQTTGADRLMLIALANYADETGECYPSVKRLAADCNCSERAAQYTIRRLIELGVVTKYDQAATDWRIRADKRPNVYRINGVQPVAPGGVDGVQRSAQRGATERANGVQPIAPKPSMNHQENRGESAAAEWNKPDWDELRGRVKRKAS